MQRHHLLPHQIMSRPSLRAMIEGIDQRRVGFDDFRVNGLLLPAREESALATSLPLHRGPHRHYNSMVMERVGQIERDWSVRRGSQAVSAEVDALLMRLELLQAALRRRLLSNMGRRLMLNRRDPWGAAVDFSDLDAMAEMLWGATATLGDPFSDALIEEAAPELAFA